MGFVAITHFGSTVLLVWEMKQMHASAEESKCCAIDKGGNDSNDNDSNDNDKKCCDKLCCGKKC